MICTQQQAKRPKRTQPNNAKKWRKKRKVASRDGEFCFYCGTAFLDLSEATLDHLIPYSLLRTWCSAALVLACHPCNNAKQDSLPQEILRPSGYGPGLTPAWSPRDQRLNQTEMGASSHRPDTKWSIR